MMTATADPGPTSTGVRINIALWIVAGILAALYLAAGGAKLAKSKAELAANPNMAWTQDFS